MTRRVMVEQAREVQWQGRRYLLVPIVDDAGEPSESEEDYVEGEWVWRVGRDHEPAADEMSVEIVIGTKGRANK